MTDLMHSSHGFAPLVIRGRTLLPIVQGGMGVGISAHRLAGSVAREGALGTIASIDLRHHHADLVDACRANPSRATLEAANLTALAREIHAARALSEGRGMIAVNVMKAVNAHADYVRVACESGADAIVMGAGLPLAITEEGDAHPNFKRVLAEATPDDIVEFVSVTGLPARAVKTPWLMRYLRNETRIRNKIGTLRNGCPTALECLSVCGLRDGIEKFGHFCIDTRLAAALRGDVANGLFFRGREALPFGTAIRSVHDLIELLLTGSARPAVAGRWTYSLS